MKSRQTSPLLLGLLALLLVPAPAVAGGFHGGSFSVDPQLTPAFTQEIHDYTTTCPSGTITVRTNSPAGVAVQVDSRAAVSGKRQVSRALGESQRITVRIRAGRLVSEYSIRCLPADFPTFVAVGKLPSTVPFFAFTELDLYAAHIWRYAVIADQHGVPVWWMHVPGATPMDAQPAGPGRFMFWTGTLAAGGLGEGDFKVIDYSGTPRGEVKMANGIKTDGHEALMSSRGTWYVVSNYIREHVDLASQGGPADGKVFDTLIHEVDSQGHLLWSWNSKDHINLAETGRWWNLLRANGATPDKDGYDVAHFNALSEDGKGGLIVSFRHLDAVYRIRKSDGAIDWKLGGTTTSRSLSVIAGDADKVRHLAAQHDVRALPDGSISIYDNRTATGESPRVTRWSVNARSRTAVLLERFQDSAISDSVCCGSARRFSDGSWLVSWGGGPNIRAYNASHRTVFRMRFDGGGISYRAVPFRSTDVTRAQLLAGMDAMHPR